MLIKEAIVHRIDKVRGQAGKLTLANVCLPVNQILIDAVDKARKTYGTTSNRAYGTFEKDKLLYPFSGLLSSYYAKHLDLLNFSGTSMVRLLDEMNRQPFSTGGRREGHRQRQRATVLVFQPFLEVREGRSVLFDCPLAYRSAIGKLQYMACKLRSQAMAC